MKFCDSCSAKVCVAWFSTCARVCPDSRTWSESFQSRFGIQDPDPVSGNRIVYPGGGPGDRHAAPNAFEQLREIELRVAATLTPPEVGVCRFPARTHISWTQRSAQCWKLVSPHLPLTIVVVVKICLLHRSTYLPEYLFFYLMNLRIYSPAL